MREGQMTLDAARLQFEFRWDRREHVRLIRAVARYRLTSRLNRMALPLIVGAFLLFILVLPLLRPNADWLAVWIAATPWLIILGLWIALFRWGIPQLNAYNFSRQNHCAQHPMRRIVSAEGLRTECETTSADIRWAGIRGVVETSEFFLFYVTPSCAIQLPKRAIRSRGELNQLRSILREQLGDRATLLNLVAGAAA